MNAVHALVLGALQGFTEVLPISSSGHLILVPWLLKWPESGLTFDVALHLGTFLALAAYFRRDILEMCLAAVEAISTRSLSTPGKRLPFLVVASAVPAAIIGKLFEKRIEEMVRTNIVLIACLLVLFGLILGLADTLGRKREPLDRLSFSSAMSIGLMQCLALLPGVSRSGITMTAGLALGFSREAAARFSFLMSLPIVAGAAMLKLLHLFKHGIPAGEGVPMLIGIVVSAITGYISVAFLLKLVQKNSLGIFVWYRVLAGGLLLAAIAGGFVR